MWVRKTLKIGKSLGMIFPVQVSRQLKIQRGDYIFLKMLENTILTISKLGDPEADKILRIDTKYEDRKISLWCVQ